MADDLKPIEPGNVVATEAPDTPNSYAGGAPEDQYSHPGVPKAPNSFYLPFGAKAKHPERRAYISWQSDSPIAVLALMMLCILLVALGVCAVLTAWKPENAAIQELMKVLGQAVLTIVGAIVGASAASSTKKD